MVSIFRWPCPGERHSQRLLTKGHRPTPGDRGSEHALGKRPGEFLVGLFLMSSLPSGEGGGEAGRGRGGGGAGRGGQKLIDSSLERPTSKKTMSGIAPCTPWCARQQDPTRFCLWQCGARCRGGRARRSLPQSAASKASARSLGRGG